MTCEFLFETCTLLRDIRSKIQTSGLKQETLDKINDNIDGLISILYSKDVVDQTHYETREDTIKVLENNLNFNWNHNDFMSFAQVNKLMRDQQVNIVFNSSNKDKVFTVTDAREEN